MSRSILMGCLIVVLSLVAMSAQTGEIIGSTGRFVNATGAIEGEGTARVLLAEPEGHVFGDQHGTIKGTISLPGGVAE
jgi:hypothetical protein